MPGFSGLSNQRRDLRNRLAPGFESLLVLGFTAIVERLLRGVSVLACFDMSVWTGSSDVSMFTVGSAARDDECLPRPKVGTRLQSGRSIPSGLNRLHIAMGETPNSHWCRPASSAIHNTTPSTIAPVVAPQLGAG